MISRAFFLLLAFMATATFALVDKKTYIVHMDQTKMAATYPKTWYEGLMNSVHEISIEGEEEDTTPPDLLYTYENAVSGFATKLSIKQLETLKKMDGFLYAIPDRKLRHYTTHTPQFLGLQSGKGLWTDSNLASDVVIGVIDTGIWPEHKSFHDSGMPPVPAKWKGKCDKGTKFSPSNCNKKLIGARYFYKGYEADNGKVNQTTDFLSPRDANGHGTHTASTAAGNVVEDASLFGYANGSARGMRYTSRIAVYKVLWEKGGTTSDAMAAMDQAVADGVDVLSLSLGGGEPPPYYLDGIATAAFGAIQKGVSVVCAAGNDGPSPYTATNTAPWIMTIAASYLDRSFPTTIKLGNGVTFQGSSLYLGSATKQLPLVYGKAAGDKGAEYCLHGLLNRKLVEGKMVVCKQGGIGGTDKGQQIKLAGGAGMLLLNDDELQGEELIAESHVLPASALTSSAGKAVIKYLNSSKTTASIAFEGTLYGTRAPMMAAFSSRGPNKVDLNVIKPDMTAPGANILAAWPPIIGPSLLTIDKRSVEFNIISGTSMACPHVSGLVALLKSAHKDWSPAAIKSALMTTAYNMDNKKAPIADVADNFKPATPFALGSGHVNPEAAVDPGLVYDINADDYLNYLCSIKYSSTQIAAISRRRFTCPKKHAPQPGDLNYPSFVVLFKGAAKNVSLTYKRTLTNVGTPMSSYMVHMEEPNGVTVAIKPNILKFKQLGQKLSYTITFFGHKTTKNPTYGSLVWVSGKYAVRSPIVATWQ